MKKMRNGIIIAFALIISLYIGNQVNAVAAPPVLPQIANNVSTTIETNAAQEMLDLINEMRANPELYTQSENFSVQAPLALDPVLQATTEYKNLYMVNYDDFSHDYTAGPLSEVSGSGIFFYQSDALGENIVQDNVSGTLSPAEVLFYSWLESPLHLANMMSADYSYIGISVLEDDLGKLFGVQQFAGSQPESINTLPNPLLEVEVVEVASLPSIFFDMIGSSSNVNASVVPANASNQNLTYTTDDSSIATVSADGTVTAERNGMTTIRVTADNGKFTTVSINVAAIIEVSDVQTTTPTLNFTTDNNAPQQIIANVLPIDATNQTLTYTSTDETVATVDANGLVSQVGVGSAIIKVQSVNGIIVEVDVEVTETPEIEVTEVIVSSDIMFSSLTTSQIEASVLPVDATNPALTYTSLDEAVATVDANGLVTAVANGSTTIEVTSSNNITKVIVVNVTIPDPIIEVTEVVVSGNIEFTALETSQITASVLPINATNQTLTYTSLDDSIATVDATGLVTAVANGSTFIEVKSNNNIIKSIDVTVNIPDAPIPDVLLTITGSLTVGSNVNLSVDLPGGVFIYDETFLREVSSSSATRLVNSSLVTTEAKTFTILKAGSTTLTYVLNGNVYTTTLTFVAAGGNGNQSITNPMNNTNNLAQTGQQLNVTLIAALLSIGSGSVMVYRKKYSN